MQDMSAMRQGRQRRGVLEPSPLSSGGDGGQVCIANSSPISPPTRCLTHPHPSGHCHLGRGVSRDSTQPTRHHCSDCTFTSLDLIVPCEIERRILPITHREGEGRERGNTHAHTRTRTHTCTHGVHPRCATHAYIDGNWRPPHQ
jgi:hypothetical protein